MIKASLDKLCNMLEELRDKDNGCLWCQKQTLESIVKHTIEESYEVAEVIENKTYKELPGELADLLLQVLFYSQIAKEDQLFDISDVILKLEQKLFERNQHVFGDKKLTTLSEISQNWEKKKDYKKNSPRILTNITSTLPALTKAYKIQHKAATVGFDWPEIKPVFEKLQEEVVELKQEIDNSNYEACADELGDLLFTCVNLSRKLAIDPETALRRANRKFMKRFETMEDILTATNETFADKNITELEALWQKAKKHD